MSPRWERIAAPPPEPAAFVMDAVLTPHRSLSLKAFRLMLIVVIAVNVVLAAFFIANGAFPVAGFLGLDVLALWLAFVLNYRAGRAEERVAVAPERIHIARRAPGGAEQHWIANPLWARVSEDGLGVAIRCGRGQVRVGAFLSPPERREFARALDQALWRAKRGG